MSKLSIKTRIKLSDIKIENIIENKKISHVRKVKRRNKYTLLYFNTIVV